MWLIYFHVGFLQHVKLHHSLMCAIDFTMKRVYFNKVKAKVKSNISIAMTFSRLSYKHEVDHSFEELLKIK